MKALLPICIIAIGLIHTIQAQQPTDPASELPKGPLLSKLPANMRCTIAVTDLAAQPGADGQPAKVVTQIITMVRSGNVGLDEIKDVKTGKKTETWVTGMYKVLIDPSIEFPIVTTTGYSTPEIKREQTETSNLNSAPDYPGMESISRKNFTGIVTAGGRKCLAFSDSESESAAYVDLESRFPVSAKSMDKGYTYQFSEAPAGSITLPSAALKAIAAAKQRMERLSGRATL